MSEELSLTGTRKGVIRVDQFIGDRTTTWVLHTEMTSQQFVTAIADILAIVEPETFKLAVSPHYDPQGNLYQDSSHYPNYAESLDDPESWDEVDRDRPGGGRRVTTVLGAGVDWAKENEKYAAIPPPA